MTATLNLKLSPGLPPARVLAEDDTEEMRPCYLRQAGLRVAGRDEGDGKPVSYRVYHEASGAHVGPALRNGEHILALVAALLSLGVDWTKPHEHLSKQFKALSTEKLLVLAALTQGRVDFQKMASA